MVSEFSLKLLKQSSQRYRTQVIETNSSIRLEFKIGIRQYSVIVDKIYGNTVVCEKKLGTHLFDKPFEELIKEDINANPITLLIVEFINIKRRQNGKSKLKSFFNYISKIFNTKR